MSQIRWFAGKFRRLPRGPTLRGRLRAKARGQNLPCQSQTRPVLSVPPQSIPQDSTAARRLTGEKNCDRTLRRRATFAAGRAPPPGGRRCQAKPAALTAPALTPSNSRPTGTRRHFNLPRPPVPQPPTALSRRPKPGVSRAHCWLQKTCRCIPIPLIPIPLHARFSAQLNFLYFSLVAERSRQR
jgi:hypothetical protein